MKKLFLFIAILLSLIAKSQTWNTTNTGSKYTRSNFLGVLSADSGNIIGSVSSLTNCHLNSTFGSLVAFGDSLYFRSTTKWINLSRGGSASSNAFVNGGNSFGSNAFLGTNDRYSLFLGTRGRTTILVGSDGSLSSTLPIAYSWYIDSINACGFAGNSGIDHLGNFRVSNNDGYIYFSEDGYLPKNDRFGFRDSAGLVMFKDSLGTWKRFASSGSISDTNYFKLNYDNVATSSNAYTGFNSFSYGKLGIRGTSLGKGVFNYDDGGGVNTEDIYFDNSSGDTVAYKSYVQSYVNSNVPIVTLQDATTNGNTTTDSIIASAFKRTGGTSSQFLKANGSVDNSTYLTTAITSVATNTATGITGGTITTTGTLAIDTTLISTRAWRQRGIDSLNTIISTKGTGSVTSIATGLGLSGGTITTSGTLLVDTASTSIISRQRAATTYFPLLGGTLTGTAGAGFVGFPLQSTRPSTPSTGFRLFADSLGRYGWVNSSGYIRSFSNPSVLSDLAFTLPSVSTTLAGLGVTQTFTGLNTFSPSVTGANATGLVISPSLAPTANSQYQYGLRAPITFNYGAGFTYNNRLLDLNANYGQLVFSENNSLTTFTSSTATLEPTLFINRLGGTGFANLLFSSSGTVYAGIKANYSTSECRFGAFSSGGYFLTLYSNNSEVARFFATGNVSIGSSSDNGAGKLQVTGDVSLTTAGNKLKIATGSNASVGTATLSGGTALVSTTAVSASSIIMLTVQETGTNNGRIRVSAKVASTSFTISSSDAGDNCVVAYQIIN